MMVVAFMVLEQIVCLEYEAYPLPAKYQLLFRQFLCLPAISIRLLGFSRPANIKSESTFWNRRFYDGHELPL